jgi:hypothetical protein
MITMLLAAAANVIVAPVPPGATFGNWTVSCDNGRHCEAIGLPSADGTETEWVLYMARSAAGSAAPKIMLTPGFDSSASGVVHLRIDGKDTGFRFDENGDPVGPTVGLLGAVAGARKVEVVNLANRSVGTVPVTGASAALRWVDDRQKRAGTITAIVAKGPAKIVPAPPPLPRIAQPPASKAPPRKLRAADIKAIKALGTDYCDDDVKEVATYRLDAKHSVGIVGCMMGAYQGASVIVVIDEGGHWTPASIEQPRAPDGEADPVDFYLLTEADYDPASRLLSEHAKGRGLADCGQSATWAWDGKMFRLASFQALDECLGAPPGTWLSRWQTANDPLKDE